MKHLLNGSKTKLKILTTFFTFSLISVLGECSQLSTETDFKESFEQWTKKTQKVKFDFFFGPNPAFSLSKEKIINFVEKGRNCLNNSFKKAGFSDLKIEFEINNISELSHDKFKYVNQEPDSFEPIDENGQFINKSCQNNQVMQIYLTDKISHAVYFVDKTNRKQIENHTKYMNFRKIFSKIGHPINLVKVCLEDKNYEKCPSEYQNIDKKEFGRRFIQMITDFNALLLEKYLAPYANAVWYQNYAIDNNDDYQAMLFAHEFMHTFGGFNDRYHFPKIHDQTKLMGNGIDWTCKLEENQIRAFYEYQTKCKPEFIDIEANLRHINCKLDNDDNVSCI